MSDQALDSRRLNLRDVVELLAQTGDQWNSFHGWGGIDDAYHVVFDDLSLGDDVEGAVGLVIFRSEVPLVETLVREMGTLLNEIGQKGDEVAALSAAAWPGVSRAAARLREAMDQNGTTVMRK